MTTDWLDELTRGPVFEATATAYMVIDPKFRIRGVNRAYERTSGYSRRLLVGE